MSQQPPEKVYWIIWAALLSAIAVYAVLAFSGAASTPEASDASQIDILAKILGGISAVNLMIAFSVRRWVASRSAIPEEIAVSRPSLSSFAAHVVSWALTESVALCGLVLALRGAPREWWLLLMAASAVAMLLLRPHLPEETEISCR